MKLKTKINILSIILTTNIILNFIVPLVTIFYFKWWSILTTPFIFILFVILYSCIETYYNKYQCEYVKNYFQVWKNDVIIYERGKKTLLNLNSLNKKEVSFDEILKSDSKKIYLEPGKYIIID